jgi:hypothetical protein
MVLCSAFSSLGAVAQHSFKLRGIPADLGGAYALDEK